MNSFSLNRKVTSLKEKMDIIHQFKCMTNTQERTDLRNADPLFGSIVLNKSKIKKQYSLMKTKLAGMKTVAVEYYALINEAKKKSLLKRVIVEWYRRSKARRRVKLTAMMLQEKVEKAMDILSITTLPSTSARSLTNHCRKCCYFAKKNYIKEFQSETLSLRTIAIELIKQEGFTKECALNVFGLDITKVEEEESEEDEEESNELEEEEEQLLNPEKKSLELKFNITRKHGLMNNKQKAKLNEEIGNIIANKASILAQYNSLNGKTASTDEDVRSRNICEKFSLLLKVMVEWYLRVENNLDVEQATFEMLKNKTFFAFSMFRFPSLPPSAVWLNSLWTSCQAARTKSRNMKKSSLDLGEIIKDVLEREGISRKRALTNYGVDMSHEQEVRACKVPRLDNEQHASGWVSFDRIEVKMEDLDDFDAVTCSTVTTQQRNINTKYTKEEDEKKTVELHDNIKMESSDCFDIVTSTEYIINNDPIKEEFDIPDDVKPEESPISLPNACTAIKLKDDDSETSHDFPSGMFIRPSIRNWLIQNGYEIEADPQQEASSLVQQETNSISPLEPSEKIKIEVEDSLSNECNAVEKTIDPMSNKEDESIAMFTFINEDMVRNEMTYDPTGALSTHKVIKVEVSESRTTEDYLKDAAATSTRDNAQNWLTNKYKNKTTDNVQKEQSNEDSALKFSLKTTDRIKIDDNLNNEYEAVKETIGRISNLDNEDDDSFEMVIFIDEDATEAIEYVVLDDPQSALNAPTVTLKVEANESQSSDDVCMLSNRLFKVNENKH